MKRTVEFKVEIGQNFKDEKRDLTIIDREIREVDVKLRGLIKKRKYRYYKFKCNKCTYTEWKEENNLLKGVGCGCCSGKITVKGINDLATTHPWMLKLGVSLEDGQKYSKCSNQKIVVKCPKCNNEKLVTIYDIFRCKSISCNCDSDGYSYSEKFFAEFLNQLGVEYTTQITKTIFKWCNNYRYDFYIPSINTIIEVHGNIHYKYTGLYRTLEEIQKNDKEKEILAKSNNIDGYIVINCMEANKNYIKDSILNNHDIISLFGNKINKIDWDKCNKAGTSSLVTEVCKYWNNRKNNESTKDLSEVFSLNRSTVIEYLKKGAELNICNYNPKEELRKSSANPNRNRYKGKKVEIFKDGISLGIFQGCSELSRKSEELFGVKLYPTSISAVCIGKRSQNKGFTFKYVEENKVN